MKLNNLKGRREASRTVCYSMFSFFTKKSSFKVLGILISWHNLWKWLELFRRDREKTKAKVVKHHWHHKHERKKIGLLSAKNELVRAGKPADQLYKGTDLHIRALRLSQLTATLG